MSGKSIYVLDACALIALLRNEPGSEVIETCLFDADADCIIHAVNLCEAAYDSMRCQPDSSPLEWIASVEAFGIRVYWEINTDILTESAQLKAHWRRISLADCFALALTHHLGGALITSDHHEFDPLVSAGQSGIFFFR